MSDQLLTVAQVCDVLHVSKPTLYQLLRDGHLASLTIGRSRRIPQSSVEDFIAQRLAEVAS